jgi:ribosomal protein L37E
MRFFNRKESNMSMVFCRACGKKIHETAPACPHCGAPRKALSAATANKTTKPKVEEPIPNGVKGWSWGAFALSWIWAIGNNTWIGLLALIPYVGIVMPIILGIKGREWAWKNNQWESVEHFNRVQAKWSFWGKTILSIGMVFLLLAMILGIIAATRT